MMAQQQQMLAEQQAQQQAMMAQQMAMQQGQVPPQGQPVDMDMQSGQPGVTGWDGRTFDQAQQGVMA